MPEGRPKRATRVAERVREEITKELSRHLTDPRLSSVMITAVRMPDDLQLAHVMVRLVQGGNDEAERKRVLAGLQAASGILRKKVGAVLGLRRAPELRFEYDAGQDAVDRIDEVLQEIARDRTPQS